MSGFVPEPQLVLSDLREVVLHDGELIAGFLSNLFQGCGNGDFLVADKTLVHEADFGKEFLELSGQNAFKHLCWLALHLFIHLHLLLKNLFLFGKPGLRYLGLVEEHGIECRYMEGNIVHKCSDLFILEGSRVICPELTTTPILPSPWRYVWSVSFMPALK